ncbi:MAG: 3-isopropylmalate dehydrogenase [Fusobacterium gastrosuis]|uniref:3-isopropylmalate dehydrogenase n=1 Tax=Fusobacterium gastrosuis TaxID=1755100 RepID=UPI002A9D8AA6|nr:3-isopropylmalate dehydrogenase [Fusobacterium gastrosuis]
MEYKIAVLKGDGIGPEIITEAIKVLDKVAEKYGHKFVYQRGCLGGESIDKYGVPYSEETSRICRNSDAILLGAVGGPKWNEIEADKRPEKGLLAIRKELAVYTNLRPAILFKELRSASPLKDEIVEDGLDVMIVRELTGGIYFGPREYSEEKAVDTMPYTRNEIERIARKAFEIARNRNKKLTSVDKHNVLDTSKLWRKIVNEVAKDYPDIEVSHMYVDNAAMQLIINPRQFDVILTENMFGDILSDEASMLTGSLGMLPSASLGDEKLGLYEPCHGSAPDIAGQNIANPIATIMSAAMMLRYSFGLEKEALAIEKAIQDVLSQGYRTADIYTEGTKKIGTAEMGSQIANKI